MVVSDKALKASFIYLKGKITDLLSDTYSKAAEDLISKAVSPFFVVIVVGIISMVKKKTSG